MSLSSNLASALSEHLVHMNTASLNRLLGLTYFMLGLFFLTTAQGQAPTHERADVVFGRLLGTWIGSSPSGKPVMEKWTVDPAAPTERIIGRAYRIRGADTLLTETVEIKNIEGAWCYVVKPANQALTVFKSVPRDSGFVFENLAHDFPKRIGYEPGTGDQLDQLTAWIEGPAPDGSVKRLVYRYKRV